jgi:hypothetical protein
MAQKKSTTLPEFIINDPKSILSKQALIAHEAREKVNEFTADEKEWKEKICVNAEALRDNMAEEEPPNIIGKIIIAPPNQTATRVEFRLNNGSLDIDELENLDALFGEARPELFEKVVIVDKITDPAALIKALLQAGLNPFDYLNVSVKENIDQVIIDKGTGIVTADAILPKKGFLTILPDLISRFSEDAKKYIRLYLKEALNPTVILGTKAKK